MVDELDFLTRDIVTDGRLNEKGMARAEFIARAMKQQTAQALAILYAKVAELAAPAPGKGKGKRNAAKRPGRKGGEK